MFVRVVEIVGEIWIRTQDAPPGAFRLSPKAAFVHDAQASAKLPHERGGVRRRRIVLIMIAATDPRD